MPRDQQQAIAELFVTMAGESPLVEPDASSPEALTGGVELATSIAALIHRDTGLRRSNHRYAGWLGVECPNVRSAVWMMRALVATNVLSRREGTVLFVPVNAMTDPQGTIVSEAVARVYHCASARGVC
jgi:sirohydrochlorin cobaltochelatase